MERKSVSGQNKTKQKQKCCPNVRALYSQPQSTASAENDIKSLFHTLSNLFPRSFLFYFIFLPLLKKFELI